MAELTRQLLQRRTTASSSDALDFPEEAYLSDLLLAGYAAEVRYHGRMPIDGQTVRTNLDAIAKAIRASRTDGRFGVWISGLYGNGKTTAMMAMESAFHALTQDTIASKRKGVTSKHPDFNAKLIVRSAKDIARLYLTDWDEYKRLTNVQCLGVEDLGNEPAEVLEYGNVIKPMVDFIERRYDSRLFTVVTTNLTPEEVQKRYGERVFDRLREMFGELVVFENKSFRAR